MSRLVRTLLFTLVAAWLPVTLHCRLEAAGFYGTDDCCATEQAADATDHCNEDACPTVEETLFKESAQTLKATAPAACELPVCFALLIPGRDRDPAPALSIVRHAPPPELGVAWQFLSRAAPPARAPSLNTVSA